MERHRAAPLKPTLPDPGTRKKSGRRWLLLAVAPLIPLGFSLSRPGPVLEVSVIGCSLVRSDLSCVPDGKGAQHLRLWVRSDPAATLLVLKWGLPLAGHWLPTDQGRLLELDEPAGAGTLRVVARVGGRVSVRTLRIREPSGPPWLTEAWTLRNQSPLDGAARATEFLARRQKDAEMLRGEDRADYLSLKARLAHELNEPDAESLLHAAIKDCKASGLLSNQLENVLWLCERLATRSGQIEQAERILREHHGDFERLVEWQPWELKQQALHLARRGDIQGAIERVEKGQQLAHRTANWNSLSDLNTFGADLFARLGRLQQAVESLENPLQRNGTGGTGLHACRQIEVASAKAELWLRAREAEPRQPLPSGLPDPSPLLFEALELTRECDQPQRRSTAFTYLARVTLQRGDLTAADAWIAKARQTNAQDDSALAPYLLQLQAEIALRLGRLDAARSKSEELLRFAQRLLLPEFEWHALIGLAQIAEQEAGADRQATARTHYEQAERILDQEALATPLGLGRGGFLGRYQRGTALFLEFLISHGELTAALQVLRHARVRGIRSLSVLTQIPQMLARAPQEYQAALGEYHAARAALNVVAQELPRVPKDREIELKQQQQQLNERALRALERIVHALGEQSADTRSPARPPAAGEAFLACHPGTGRWLCLLENAKGIWFTPVATELIEEDQPQRALAEALLEPFRASIEQAQRLTVIAYGALRELDIQLLPFGPSNRPLGAQREVVFALDLPVKRTDASAGPARSLGADTPASAYVLLDPEGRFHAIRDTAGGISLALRQLRFRVLKQGTGLVDQNGGDGKHATVHQRLNSSVIRDQISRSVLFHAAAHVDYARTNGWHHALALGDDAGLMLSDILTLPKVPAYVSLFTCESGRTAEEWGSAEGMGMAQAFLAQGSQWAIGTVRQVSADLAASISQRFFQRLAVEGDLRSPVRALYAAVTEGRPLPESTRQRSHETDLGAFRVYVP